jgi:hypothetical protein
MPFLVVDDVAALQAAAGSLIVSSTITMATH